MRSLIYLFLLFLVSCGSEVLRNEAQLHGDWQAVSWLDTTNDQPIDVEVTFAFDADGRYVGTYGQATEVGKYWLEGDNLHTIEDGKAEKKVKIEKLTADTLVFGMNRAGNEERITLVKKP